MCPDESHETTKPLSDNRRDFHIFIEGQNEPFSQIIMADSETLQLNDKLLPDIFLG